MGRPPMTAKELFLQHEALVKEYGAHVPYFLMPMGVLESVGKRNGFPSSNHKAEGRPLGQDTCTGAPNGTPSGDAGWTPVGDTPGERRGAEGTDIHRRAEGAAATALGGSVLHHSEPPSSASTCPPPKLFPPEPKCWLCITSDIETEICPRHQLRLDEIAEHAKRAATASCVNCSTIADLDGDARCIACAVPAYHDRDDS
jgi:hypothetical protein